MRLSSTWKLLLALLVTLIVASPAAAQTDDLWRWNRVNQNVERDASRVVTFAVRVESPLPIDADDAAATVAEILDDERSWTGLEDVAFQLVADRNA